MHNESAKCEIKTNVFSGRKSQAGNYCKLINVRGERSTALVTNIDFEAWGNYLGDPPLAMAFLDRIVDGAIILKINGKSYRLSRAQPATAAKPASV